MTYFAETVAWDGTLLDERPGYRCLVQEAQTLTESAWWRSQAGPVSFEQIRSHTLAGDAGGGHVRLVHSAHRGTVPHELAHILHRAKRLSGDAHGLNFRNVYVVVVNRLYGEQYGRLLHTAFEDHGLRMSPYKAPTYAPAIDIDRVCGVVHGGWQRTS
jgi:hypothetical protein